METGHGLVMNLKDAVCLFLEEFKQEESYRDRTFLKYDECLKKFLKYSEDYSLVVLQNVTYEFLEGYKLYLFKRMGINTIRTHITALRQFLNYSHIKGWSSISGNHLRVPNMVQTQTAIINDDVLHELLNQEWGQGSLNKKRNKVIFYFLIKMGLSPSEICNVTTSGFSKKESTVVLNYQAKFGKNKMAAIDETFWGIIQDYVQCRNNYLDVNKIKDDGYLMICHRGSLEPSGIQAMLRAVQKDMRKRGCLLDIRKLNAQTLKRTSDAKNLRGHETYKKIFLVEKKREIFSEHESFIQADSTYVVSSMEKVSEIMSLNKKYEGKWWWAVTKKSVDSFLVDEGSPVYFNKEGIPIDVQPSTFKNMLPKMIRGGYFSRETGIITTHKGNVPVPDGYTQEQWDRRLRVSRAVRNHFLKSNMSLPSPSMEFPVSLETAKLPVLSSRLKVLFYRLNITEINGVNSLIKEDNFPNNLLKYSGTGRKTLLDFFKIFKQNILEIKGHNLA